MSPPGVPGQPEEVLSSQDPQSVLGFLTELPNETIPHNTASNLTQVLEQSYTHTHTQEDVYVKHQPYMSTFLKPRPFSEVWKKCCPPQSRRR